MAIENALCAAISAAMGGLALLFRRRRRTGSQFRLRPPGAVEEEVHLMSKIRSAFAALCDVDILAQFSRSKLPLLAGSVVGALSIAGIWLLGSVTGVDLSDLTRDVVAVEDTHLYVGALSTTASYKEQVFTPALEAAGLEVVLQDPAIQEDLVNPAIFDPEFGIKSGAASVTREAREHVLRAVAHLHERGAEAVILGCTELPLAVPEPRTSDVLTVDPTRALARALIREFAPEKLRPVEAVFSA